MGVARRTEISSQGFISHAQCSCPPGQKDQQPEGSDPLWRRELSLWKKSYTSRSPGAARQGYGKAGSLRKPDGEDLKRACNLHAETDQAARIEVTCLGEGRWAEPHMQLGTAILGRELDAAHSELGGPLRYQFYFWS